MVCITVERMRERGVFSRSSLYRYEPESKAADSYMELGDAIQRIYLEMPSNGRPRITAELRRRGWKVNHKRVHRILREDNLLCVRRRKVIVTTNSQHRRRVYPNLARHLALTGVDQLWIADITYLRLQAAFIYLAV